MSDSASHKLAELTAYYYGGGTAKEREEFEKHLATCPDCQADLARMRELIPKIEQRLRQPLDTSVDAMMRLMDRAERDLLASRAARRERSARRRPWVIAGATLAAIAAASALLLVSRLFNPSDLTAGPNPPAADGG
jgi:anti-sigma factor RsiW